MSLEGDLEDCIWGRSDWQEYTKKLVAADDINEQVLLERVEKIKESIKRKIRKAVSIMFISMFSQVHISNQFIYFLFIVILSLSFIVFCCSFLKKLIKK